MMFGFVYTAAWAVVIIIFSSWDGSHSGETGAGSGSWKEAI